MPEKPVEAPRRNSLSTWRRLALLAACIVLGSIIGIVGEALGGGSAWFLAIPVLLALAWFFVGDPTACTVRRPAGPGASAPAGQWQTSGSETADQSQARLPRQRP